MRDRDAQAGPPAGQQPQGATGRRGNLTGTTACSNSVLQTSNHSSTTSPDHHNTTRPDPTANADSART